MPRKFGSVNVEIWNDPEFRRLSPAAQHLYFVLWTAPNLSFCGVHEWRPARLTHLSAGFTEEHTKTVGACLWARHFIVVDEATEEVLVRSWARFDELLKQPRLAVSYSAAYASVYSPILRSVIVHETKKMRQMWPELTCWKDPRVSSLLDHPSVSAKDLPTPEDPFGDGFGPEVGQGFALGLAQTSVNVWPSVWAPPTPAPTPTPNTSTSGRTSVDDQPRAGRKRPATSLPDDWKPTTKHREQAKTRGVDVEAEADKFRAHAEANDRRQADWNASFRLWLGNARPGERRPSTATLPNARDVEQPPDGLSDEEYAAWAHKQAERRRA